jgi:hypothetical protein
MLLGHHNITHWIHMDGNRSSLAEIQMWCHGCMQCEFCPESVARGKNLAVLILKSALAWGWHWCAVNLADPSSKSAMAWHWCDVWQMLLSHWKDSNST